MEEKAYLVLSVRELQKLIDAAHSNAKAEGREVGTQNCIVVRGVLEDEFRAADGARQFDIIR